MGGAPPTIESQKQILGRINYIFHTGFKNSYFSAFALFSQCPEELKNFE